MRLNHKGQSTVEYILLVTAVIAILILFLVKPNSTLKQKIGNTYGNVAETMDLKAQTLDGSHDTPASEEGGPDVPAVMRVDVQSNFPHIKKLSN